MGSAPKHNIDPEIIRNTFADYLKRKGYRNTQERYFVLDSVLSIDKHFNADELYLYLLQRGDKVSRATIYSTLDLLTKCNILVKHRFQGDSAHFELAGRMPNHDHMMCNECGRIVEFREKEIEDICDAVSKKHGLKMMKHSLQIFAVCDDPGTCTYNQM